MWDTTRIIKSLCRSNSQSTLHLAYPLYMVGLMFPDPNHDDASRIKSSSVARMTGAVSSDLLTPEITINLRNMAAPTASVPEAAVDKESQLNFWKIEVRPCGQVFRV